MEMAMPIRTYRERTYDLHERFSCEECGLALASPDDLMQHVQHAHSRGCLV